MAVTSKGKKDAGGSNLTGPEKAAIFLLTVGEDFTAQVFQRLSPEEIKLVGRQMAKVDKIDKEELESLLQEFKTDVGGSDLFLSGNDMLEHALKKALTGDKATEILEDIRSDWKLTLFQKARKLEPKILVNFLRNEHPQTVALVLSVLEPSQAAQVVAELPEATQVEVVMRMAELDKVGPEILVDVDRVLQDELLAVEGMEGQRLGGVEAVAELLNNAERAMEAAILEGVEEQHEAMAEEIRRLMFVFEDLLSVDDRGIQAILKEVSTDDLKVALKIASDELKEKVFGCMSSRAVELLKDDMEIMGPTRIKDVEAAQQAIIKIAKRLEQEGKVQLMVGAGEDEFV
ncbi:flagellar motor switch protein FliG [Desulfurivibrio alkaliphilus]|uniref:Flagellar motor switch protein FliG n=1 Tax=Desulfurivibrio alkaliphilus (strain DSM 19089 / UNIQEM U267 / AHT2) TaxID=589865 RepID=D6Z2W0_DESAT|nr:flagellar motor switch protein FliG [Desulfurivibrio alkaliphilus]ADH85885.1 flagellar motor switch protein FliG [Desulfurivibrio alkaliphilus AHT 2]